MPDRGRGGSAEAARLDGCYVLKTDLPRTVADTEVVHERYKDLALVEQAFRTCKTAHLEVRPVYVRTAASTRGHALVVMVAYAIIRECSGPGGIDHGRGGNIARRRVCHGNARQGQSPSIPKPGKATAAEEGRTQSAPRKGRRRREEKEKKKKKGGNAGMGCLVGADVGGPMPPTIGDTHVRPEGSRLGHAPWAERVYADERRGHGPLFVRRSRRWESAERRSGSVSPAAARGGGPASVRARRTALQSPRMPWAAGSARLSSCRARGRTPRRRLLRAFLAGRSASETGVAASCQEWKCQRWCGTFGQAVSPAPRRAAGPSERPPTIGPPRACFTSRRSSARSSWVADSMRRARSPSRDRPSRRPQRTSWPTSGGQPSNARMTRPWGSVRRGRRAVSVRDRATRASERSKRCRTVRGARATRRCPTA